MSDDRELDQALRRLGQQDWQPPASGAAAAVRTARRRTAAGLAAVGAGVAALALAVPIALSSPVAAPLPPSATLDGGPRPSSTASAPVPSAPPSTAEQPPSVAPSSGPSAVVTEAPSPTAVPSIVLAGGEDGPLVGGTLAGLLVADLQPGAALLEGEESGVASGGPSWFADACADDTATGDDRRTGFLSAAVPGSDTGHLFQAATYPDEGAAAAAVAALLDELDRCRADVGTVWRTWDGGTGEAGTVRLVTYDVDPDAGPDRPAEPQYGGAVVVRRDGATVLLTASAGLYRGTSIAYALGDTRPGVGPAGSGSAEEARASVDPLFERLLERSDRLGADVAAHLSGTTPSPQDPVTAFPPAVEPVHGGRSVAVVAAVALDGADPRLSQAVADLAEAGYQAGVGDVACLGGAAEVLGLDPARSYLAVSVVFATVEQAQQFVDAYGPGVVGTAEVTTYCLD